MPDTEAFIDTGILLYLLSADNDKADPAARKRFEILGRKTYEDFLHLHRKHIRRTLSNEERRT